MFGIATWLFTLLALGAVTFGVYNPPPVAEAAGIKMFVQWAKANPQDWALSNAEVWGSLNAKIDPVGDVSLAGFGIGDVLLDNAPGWVFAVNIQGVVFDYYDHYHVAQADTTVVVTAWRDDAIIFPEGIKQADVMTFLEPAFDNKTGQVNTRQTLIIYAQPDNSWWTRGCPCGEITVEPWANFVAPITGVKHGIYLSDAKWDEHLASRTLHGWNEWTQ